MIYLVRIIKKVTLRKIEFVEVLKCLLRLTTSNNSFVLLFIVYSLSDGITGSMLTRHYSVLIFELFCRYSWMKRHVLCLGQLRYEAFTMYSEIASVLETSILLTLLVKSNNSWLPQISKVLNWAPKFDLGWRPIKLIVRRPNANLIFGFVSRFKDVVTWNNL